MKSTSAASVQPYGPATIDIPPPISKARQLQERMAGGDPQYRAMESARGFDDDFNTILLNPGLTFGRYLRLPLK
jgi:hypothetical protein